MIDKFRSVQQRDPSEQELATLVEREVREEILVREALALGLDQGDAAVRNRLMQKLQFLTDSAVQMLDPQDDVLRAYLQDNPENFATPEMIAFDQVFIGQSASQEAMDALLAALVGGADPQTVGQGSQLRTSMPPGTKKQMDSAFGPGFFDALQGIDPGTWFGPVRSRYGQHLVRITVAQTATLPEFAEVRDKVLFDWRRVQADVLVLRQ